MENVAESSKPDARIIHLSTPEIPTKTKSYFEIPFPTADFCTLAYLDQLLDEHFK